MKPGGKKKSAPAAQPEMRAVRITRHGGPAVLAWGKAPKPVPRPGELLVRVAASAINPVDNQVRRGELPGAAGLPLVLGGEAAGIVETDSTQFRVGARVIAHDASLGVLRNGCWAQWVAAPMTSIRPMPDNMSFEQAAGLASAGVTAIGALRTLGAQSGQSLLVLGATGGVGSAAVQIARAEGLRVIAEVSRPEKVERIKALGAAAIVVLSEGPLAEQIHKLNGGRGVDLVLDPIGGAVTGHAAAALAPGGRLVHLGSAAGDELSIRSHDLIAGPIEIVGFNRLKLPPDGLTLDLHEVVQLAAQGRYHAALDRTFPISKIREAVTHFEQGRGVGKVVLLA